MKRKDGRWFLRQIGSGNAGPRPGSGLARAHAAPLLVGGKPRRFPPHALRSHCRFHRPLKTASQRTNMRNPGWSPTTVMCPLQGEVSSNRNTLPGRSFLVSPSVVVMEKMPCKTMPN
jgi:hypothetical protein